MTRLDPATARKRYLAYVLFRFAGLGLLFAGVWLGRGGASIPSVAMTLLGGATLFVRPRHLGLSR